MRRPNETFHLLGTHYRAQFAVDTSLPSEMQALLLRLALKECESLSSAGETPAQVRTVVR